MKKRTLPRFYTNFSVVKELRTPRRWWKMFRQVQEHGMKFLLCEIYVGTLYLAAGSLPYSHVGEVTCFLVPQILPRVFRRSAARRRSLRDKLLLHSLCFNDSSWVSYPHYNNHSRTCFRFSSILPWSIAWHTTYTFLTLYLHWMKMWFKKKKVMPVFNKSNYYW